MANRPLTTAQHTEKLAPKPKPIAPTVIGEEMQSAYSRVFRMVLEWIVDAGITLSTRFPRVLRVEPGSPKSRIEGTSSRLGGEVWMPFEMSDETVTIWIEADANHREAIRRMFLAVAEVEASFQKGDAEKKDRRLAVLASLRLKAMKDGTLTDATPTSILSASLGPAHADLVKKVEEAEPKWVQALKTHKAAPRSGTSVHALICKGKTAGCPASLRHPVKAGKVRNPDVAKLAEAFVLIFPGCVGHGGIELTSPTRK